MFWNSHLLCFHKSIFLLQQEQVPSGDEETEEPSHHLDPPTLEPQGDIMNGASEHDVYGSVDDYGAAVGQP